MFARTPAYRPALTLIPGEHIRPYLDDPTRVALKHRLTTYRVLAQKEGHEIRTWEWDTRSLDQRVSTTCILCNAVLVVMVHADQSDALLISEAVDQPCLAY
jgi:xanthine/CO dehydrogenase XdhC/CoxF family maturation factor